MMMNEVKRTERGWAGHFICSRDCMFRRNTLLEYGDKEWVVSTVDRMIARTTVEPYQKAGDIVDIGCNKWYETMAFEVAEDKPYKDADVNKENEFNSEWGIWGETWGDVLKKYTRPDNAANEMHETVVKELMEKIKK